MFILVGFLLGVIGVFGVVLEGPCRGRALYGWTL